MSSELTTDESTAADAWREIDQCLAEIAALAGTAEDPHAFYSGALDKALWALGASAGAVWMREADGTWAPFIQRGTPPKRDPHAVQRIIAQHDARVVRLAPAGLVAPVHVDGVPLAAIEVLEREDVASSAHPGHEQFLAAVADCAVEFHRNVLLRQLRGREAWWRRFAEFAAQVSEPRSLTRVAAEIANGARGLLDVDRASVVTWTAKQATMRAVSGVDAFDPRAAAVQSAEALAQAVLQVNEPLWFPADGQILAQQVESALERHLETSPAKALAVIPLATDESTPPAGALVLELFSGDNTLHAWHDGWTHVARQSAQALEAAIVWQALPFGGLSRRWALARRQRVQGRLAKYSLAAALGVGLLAALMFIPADFEVAAGGELQPVGLRHVFSGVEGEVVEVLASSGDTVRAGQVLARLRSPKLELETTRVWGELQTAQARLATLEAARLESRFNTTEDAAKAQQLTAEEAELQEAVKSLQSQQAVLDEERKLLEVRSPIAGRVLTPWDELDALPARPVRTGQQLFTVSDANGAWRLDLRVPDRWIGHVLAAQQDGAMPGLSFVVATEPQRRCAAKVERIAERAEIGDDGAATVLVHASVAPSQLNSPRPGASVQARIACGRRPLGYVWFHEICDRLAAWWALHT